MIVRKSTIPKSKKVSASSFLFIYPFQVYNDSNSPYYLRLIPILLYYSPLCSFKLQLVCQQVPYLRNLSLSFPNLVIVEFPLKVYFLELLSYLEARSFVE
ncbi:Piso0_001106 [Millerozyma farinosa CBS 7064]|uniref:Piso0_001106 protein n=1 Tax=Pichia sorbitophila (strain ATCC MYA-4447 / BCRC 22081 / CBS 7064 / NBRC 10061 / NRRL Y-12695) TaxID=559304 RepID=G8YSE6_PICSO|nr:Piso0_001106 [Millerozyma farinosa CBS 7064]CCE79069.1 Piso0_001106 [Millerozyma farinosa CBS 7064]